MRFLLLLTLLLCLQRADAQTAAGCTTDLYINAYHYPDGNMQFNDHAVAANGDVLITGTLRDPVEVSDGIIVKTNANGDLIWAKTFRQPGGQEFLHIIASRDGNFLVLGSFSTATTEGILLLKIDPDGNIIWQKAHTTDPIYLTFGWFREDANGNLYVSGHINEGNLSFQDRVALISFNLIGEMRYSKFYRPPDILNIITSREMVIDGPNVYICGNAYDLDRNLPSGLVIKVDKETGQQLWSKTYSFNGGGADFNHISVFGDSLRLTGYDQLNTSDTSIIMVCDKEGKVGRGKYLSYPVARTFGVQHQNNDGSFIYSNNYLVGSLSICKVDLDNGVQWFRVYDQTPGSNWQPRSLHEVPGGYLISGRLTLSSDNGLLARFDEQGRAGCAPKDITVSYGEGNFIATNRDYPAKFLDIANSPTTVDLVPYTTLTKEVQCQVTQTCTTLKLAGPAKACAGDTIRVTISRNAECSLPVQLTYDSSLLRTWKTVADTSWLIATNGGVTKVKAQFGSACTSLADSITIALSPTQGVPDLGDTRNICAGKPALLDAGPGFTSYRWQDGSAGQVHMASTPGDYHVWVTDISGCTFTDSAKVILADPPSNFLVPTVDLCLNSHLVLAPFIEFDAYAWSNGSHEQTITVTRGGSYWLEVNDRGCIGRDTIVVREVDCSESFHVPNAFTPNKDGLNETFRPFITGPTTEYRFMVFSRYGEKIFDSTDPSAGWDGMHKGARMPTGNYVWYCKYQFSGKQRQTAKGTVMLIR